MKEVNFLLFCFLKILMLGNSHTKSYIKVRPIACWKNEAGGLEVQGLSWLQSELETRLNSLVSTCLKKNEYEEGWVYSSGEEYLSRIHKALSSMPRSLYTYKKKKKHLKACKMAVHR